MGDSSLCYLKIVAHAVSYQDAFDYISPAFQREMILYDNTDTYDKLEFSDRTEKSQ